MALITPKSLAAASELIEFEIETARAEALKGRRPFFFPCVADGESFGDLPAAAMEFQGIELEEEEGLERLLEALQPGLSEDR